MPLSNGARRLYSLLQWFKARVGSIFPQHKFLAARLEVSLSSVKRWMRELVAAGSVKVRRRGPRSAEYELVEIPVENSARELSFEPSFELSSAPYLFTELAEGMNKLGRPKISTMPKTEFRMPPATLKNDAGRTIPNPEAVRVRDLLLSVQERVRRAKNPAAYERSILRREFPHLFEEVG